MEMIKTSYYKTFLISFKIDLIVWKWAFFFEKKSIENGFKIDLIVWKS